MRPALASLNIRGRSLVAAGVATALSAIVIGEDDLLRLAVVLVALPLLVAAYVALLRVRVTAHHQLSAVRVPVGTEVDVDIDVTATGRVPAGTLLCEDELSPGLGPSPRVTFRAESASTDVRLHYTCRPERRGLHQVGPLAVTIADPFGLCERTAAAADSVALVGLPVVESVPQVLLNAGWATGGVAHTRLMSGRGEDDFSIREHNPGDGLRKVHWRTSARMGKLMIRREEQLQESRAAVFLDDRASAHRGAGEHSTYERAVSLAASVGTALMGAAYRVRMFAAAGELGAEADAWSAPVLLDHLAFATPTARKDLSAGIAALRGAREDGLLIALLGDLTVGDALALSANRTGQHASIAVLTDVAAEATSPADQSPTTTGVRALRERRRDVVEVLAAHGWWVVQLAPGQLLSDAMTGAGTDGGSDRTVLGPQVSVPLQPLVEVPPS